MELQNPEVRRDDVRHRVKSIYLPLVCLATLGGAIGALFGYLSTDYSSEYNGSAVYCDASGTLQFSNDDEFPYTSPYWDPSYYLAVTLYINGLTYASAKAIDVAFDLVVGRGSQALLAVLLYPLLRRAVLREMEVRKIPLSLLVPLFLDRISLSSVLALGRPRTSGRMSPTSSEKKARGYVGFMMSWRLACIMFMVCYVLAVPTLLSAMTSYQADSTPYVTPPNQIGDVQANALSQPDLIVQDGERIGLTSNFPVFSNSSDAFNQTMTGYYESFQEAYLWWQMCARNISSSVAQQQPQGSPPTPTLWNHTVNTMAPESKTFPEGNATRSLWSITLWPHNMSDPYFIDNGFGNDDNEADYDDVEFSILYDENATCVITVSGKTWTLSSPLQVVANSDFLSYGNATFTNAAGLCGPNKSYKWGFSSLQLFTFSMLTCFISILLLALHYDAWWNSQADRYVIYISAYQDMMDLTDALRQQLESSSVESVSPTTSAKGVHESVTQQPPMVALRTDDLLPSRGAKANGQLGVRVTKSMRGGSLFLGRIWRMASESFLRRWSGRTTVSRKGSLDTEEYLLHITK